MALKVILVLIAFTLPWTISTEAQDSHVRVAAGSEMSARVAVVKNGGQAKVDSKGFVADVSLAPGKGESYDVLMLRDPSTGLFWWAYAPHMESPLGVADRLLKNSVVDFTDTKVVAFSFHHPPASLWIRESREHCANMQEGQIYALRSLDKKQGEVDLGFIKGYQIVDLWKPLGGDFVYPKSIASPSSVPALRTVTKTPDAWQVVLDGPNGDSALVSLNDKYELIGAKVIPKIP